MFRSWTTGCGPVVRYRTRVRPLGLISAPPSAGTASRSTRPARMFQTLTLPSLFSRVSSRLSGLITPACARLAPSPGNEAVRRRVRTSHCTVRRAPTLKTVRPSALRYRMVPGLPSGSVKAFCSGCTAALISAERVSGRSARVHEARLRRIAVCGSVARRLSASAAIRRASARTRSRSWDWFCCHMIRLASVMSTVATAIAVHSRRSRLAARAAAHRSRSRAVMPAARKDRSTVFRSSAASCSSAAARRLPRYRALGSRPVSVQAVASSVRRR